MQKAGGTAHGRCLQAGARDGGWQGLAKGQAGAVREGGLACTG